MNLIGLRRSGRHSAVRHERLPDPIIETSSRFEMLSEYRPLAQDPVPEAGHADMLTSTVARERASGGLEWLRRSRAAMFRWQTC